MVGSLLGHQDSLLGYLVIAPSVPPAFLWKYDLVSKLLCERVNQLTQTLYKPLTIPLITLSVDPRARLLVLVLISLCSHLLAIVVQLPMLGVHSSLQ